MKPDHSLLAATALVPLALLCIAGAGARAGRFQQQPEKPVDPLIGTIEALRADLRSGKVKTINQVMKLTDAEAAVFWPIYHDYEEELFELGDGRVELIKQYVRALAEGTLGDDKARELTAAWFQFQSERLDLMKRYEEQVRGKLSALRAAEFIQIENRFSLVIDLMIASDLPLIGEVARPR